MVILFSCSVNLFLFLWNRNYIFRYWTFKCDSPTHLSPSSCSKSLSCGLSYQLIYKYNCSSWKFKHLTPPQTNAHTGTLVTQATFDPCTSTFEVAVWLSLAGCSDRGNGNYKLANNGANKQFIKAPGLRQGSAVWPRPEVGAPLIWWHASVSQSVSRSAKLINNNIDTWAFGRTCRQERKSTRCCRVEVLSKVPRLATLYSSPPPSHSFDLCQCCVLFCNVEPASVVARREKYITNKEITLNKI